jgi:CRP/FNR family cyclic AMP-dependent transcriptional regulator
MMHPLVQTLLLSIFESGAWISDTRQQQERRERPMITGSTLKEFAFFQGFNASHLEKVAAIAVEESCEAGTSMYQKGDPARSLFLVRAGKIILVMENDMGPHRAPMQITVDVITQGESMGWSALVAPHIYTLGARCIDHVEVIALDAVKLRALLNRDSRLGYKIMQAIAKVISNRLNHTRIILIGERGLSHLTEY